MSRRSYASCLFQNRRSVFQRQRAGRECREDPREPGRDGLLCRSKTPGESLAPQQNAEVIAGLKGSHVGRGVVVPLGFALRVRRGLRKTQPSLSSCVLASPSPFLALRPRASIFLTGTPVPSPSIYMTGTPPSFAPACHFL